MDDDRLVELIRTLSRRTATQVKTGEKAYSEDALNVDGDNFDLEVFLRNLLQKVNQEGGPEPSAKVRRIHNSPMT